MTWRVPTAYVGIAGACALAPYVAVATGLSQFPISWQSMPLAFASLASGGAAYGRRAKGLVEWPVAAGWAVGAIAMSTPVSAKPPDLRVLYVAMDVIALCAGVAAVAALVASLLTMASNSPLVLRTLQAAALLVLGWPAARWFLEGRGYVAIPADGPGMTDERIAIFRAIVVWSAVAILTGALVTVALERARRGRPTRAWSRRGLRW